MAKGTNEIIYNGTNYTQVRALCLDLIKDELSKVKGVAQIEAQNRDNQLIAGISQRLGQANISGESLKSAFENPAMQLDFIEADKAYIKYGGQELCDVLSSIVVDRIKENERSLLQIALGEAIRAVALLLPTQMAALSLRFVLCHTYNTAVLSHTALVDYLKNNIIPLFKSGLCETSSEFQHLSYAKCATFSESCYSLSDILFDRYGGLFSNGFDLDDIPNVEEEDSIFNKDPNMFIKCLNNDTKYQIDAININQLNEKLEQLNLSSDERAEFEKLFYDYKMTAEQIRQRVLELCPEMEEVFDYCDSTSMKSLNLSAVGIVIGASYAGLKIGKNFDLKIWI